MRLCFHVLPYNIAPRHAASADYFTTHTYIFTRCYAIAAYAAAAAFARTRIVTLPLAAINAAITPLPLIRLS